MSHSTEREQHMTTTQWLETISTQFSIDTNKLFSIKIASLISFHFGTVSLFSLSLILRCCCRCLTILGGKWCWLTRINESKQCERQMALISLNFIFSLSLVWRWNEAGIMAHKKKGVERVWWNETKKECKSDLDEGGGIVGGKMNYGITHNPRRTARWEWGVGKLFVKFINFGNFRAEAALCMPDKTWS